MLLVSVVWLEGLRIPDLTLTYVGHELHRERMASVESNKGAALASRLTISFLVMTEETAKRICQQPGLSLLLLCTPALHTSFVLGPLHTGFAHGLDTLT